MATTIYKQTARFDNVTAENRVKLASSLRQLRHDSLKNGELKELLVAIREREDMASSYGFDSGFEYGVFDRSIRDAKVGDVTRSTRITSVLERLRQGGTKKKVLEALEGVMRKIVEDRFNHGFEDGVNAATLGESE